MSLHFLQLVCKPGSVLFCLLQKKLKQYPSFILPLHCCSDHTTYPPASDEQPSKPVYMVFQPIRCTAPDVTTRTGKLLPHLFTLTRQMADGYFLLHYNTLADIFPLGSMVLCVARTFLSPLRLRSEGNDGTTCCPAKVIIKENLYIPYYYS